MRVTKALFLDRDGIVNVDHGYVYRKEDFQFVDGIFELCRLFAAEGFDIFVVTNQSGIGRGYYTLGDFLTLSEWMVEQFVAKGVKIERIYYCPHSPEEDCRCRKPGPGMIEQALKEREIDLISSWLIGDKHSDIELAEGAGIGKSVFIGSRKDADATYSFPALRELYHYLSKRKELLKDDHDPL